MEVRVKNCPDCLACEQCGKPMNPADWLVNPTCLTCAKQNQREVTGG